ncbi:hypothetical protein Hanom_Chr13g01243031 [Helianthus anomalus]
MNHWLQVLIEGWCRGGSDRGGLVVCMRMIGGWGVEMTVVIVEDEGGWWVFLEREGEGGRRWQCW